METFDELVIEHDSGNLNQGISRKMRALLKELKEHAQEHSSAKGEISLKVTFKVTSNGRIEIETSTSAKGPCVPRTKETRWVGPKGSIVSEDPRQTVMFKGEKETVSSQ
jgi:hypothetical protein